MSLLRAWAQPETSFAADVRVVHSAGADRKRFAEDYKQYVRWLESAGKRETAQMARENLAGLEVAYDETTAYYRYLSRGWRFRVEMFRDVAPGPSTLPWITEVYTGDRWQSLRVPPKGSAGDVLPEMNVWTNYRSTTPLLEVARGQAVAVRGWLQTGQKLSQRAVATGQLHWGEFFQVVMDPAMTKELTLPYPGTKEEMPVLELASPPWKDSGMGVYRVRIWFDRKRGHSLARLECCSLEPDEVRGGYLYVTDLVVEWSDPVVLANGILFPTKAKVRHFHRFYKTVLGEPPEKWVRAWYEVMVDNVEFSHVRVDEPAPDTQFTLTPPPGTNVVDETAGYRYLAGSAGEQLGKSALSLRQMEPGVLGDRRWSRWRIWLVALAVLLVCGVVCGTLWRFRRAGK